MVVLEWIAIVAFAGLWLFVLGQVALGVAALGPVALLALLAVPLGFVGADLFTGFGHFFADNFAAVDTPIIGHALVFRFRQHHEDQLIICGLTFRELNGGLAMLMVPALALTAAFAPVSASLGGLLVGVFVLSLALFGAATNQIHRWAHDARRPALVVPLQRAGVLLSPLHHAGHHRAPHDVRFCITAGWLNPWLDRAGVWHRLADLLVALRVPQADESVMGWRRQEARAAARSAPVLGAEALEPR